MAQMLGDKYPPDLSEKIQQVLPLCGEERERKDLAPGLSLSLSPSPPAGGGSGAWEE